MSIHVHKTGLNKTLGQQSDAIVTTNLIGNFVPSLGVASTYWTNQVSDGEGGDELGDSSSALRRFNGITHVNYAPHAFQFDGVDDYLGAAGVGYGGDPFNVAFQNAYTISQWVYLPNSWSSGKKHHLFYFYENGSNYIMFMIDSGVVEMHSYTSGGNLANAKISVEVSMIVNRNKWLYHTITHNGSGVYTYFLNGKFVGTVNAPSAPTASAKPMNVGVYGSSYSSAGVNVAHIHVHSSVLSNSQIRQNYLASHDMHNTRLYGDTTLA